MVRKSIRAFLARYGLTLATAAAIDIATRKAALSFLRHVLIGVVPDIDVSTPSRLSRAIATHFSFAALGASGQKFSSELMMMDAASRIKKVTDAYEGGGYCTPNPTAPLTYVCKNIFYFVTGDGETKTDAIMYDVIPAVPVTGDTYICDMRYNGNSLDATFLEWKANLGTAGRIVRPPGMFSCLDTDAGAITQRIMNMNITRKIAELGPLEAGIFVVASVVSTTAVLEAARRAPVIGGAITDILGFFVRAPLVLFGIPAIDLSALTTSSSVLRVVGELTLLIVYVVAVYNPALLTMLMGALGVAGGISDIATLGSVTKVLVGAASTIATWASRIQFAYRGLLAAWAVRRTLWPDVKAGASALWRAFGRRTTVACELAYASNAIVIRHNNAVMVYDNHGTRQDDFSVPVVSRIHYHHRSGAMLLRLCELFIDYPDIDIRTCKPFLAIFKTARNTANIESDYKNQDELSRFASESAKVASAVDNTALGRDNLVLLIKEYATYLSNIEFKLPEGRQAPVPEEKNTDAETKFMQIVTVAMNTRLPRSSAITDAIVITQRARAKAAELRDPYLCYIDVCSLFADQINWPVKYDTIRSALGTNVADCPFATWLIGRKKR